MIGAKLWDGNWGAGILPPEKAVTTVGAKKINAKSPMKSNGWILALAIDWDIFIVFMVKSIGGKGRHARSKSWISNRNSL